MLHQHLFALTGVKMDNLATRTRFLHTAICDTVEAVQYAVEHVLAYSGACPQVPYNQCLRDVLPDRLRPHLTIVRMAKTKHQDDGKQSQIRQIVEQAVAQALQSQLTELQSRIVQQVLDTLPQQPGEGAQSGSSANANVLVQAVSNIHAGSTQKEILRALLDAGSGYCSRIALFVVKAGAATGWHSRGFGGEDPVKDFALDLSIGPVAHSYQNRIATPGNIAEMGSAFIDRFGKPANEQMLVLPLLLKDKVAAIVYADGGETGQLDPDALELLVMTTSAWLEVASLRKQASKEDAGRMETAPSVQTVSSFSDPFSAHAPKHAVAHVPEQVVEVPAAHASAAAAPAAAADPLAGLSPEDAEIHRKAQRFARLLVDEIKLYNQAKVAEGRRNKDLYDRLREDIEKSRGTFQKRYGNTAAASADYFHHELLRSLAEDDISVMGSNFHR